ncbi:response regulator [Kaistella antarctica]|uniref:histidine kinase n=1 Tax=Kaistella antarctica TaxID=266748 RepID=A0A3S4YSJ8_9FLAO|nr:response regulator [Kaistella antarctica]KEY19185.1 histidine kinase [Kaistella antarctica]SEW03809.1 Signal transduction histidine kinase [Kaistella antarctica]VEH98749.1 Autoinducer 2 sensor kinase/phosphatase luxQ [Kaistella antarctica]
MSFKRNLLFGLGLSLGLLLISSFASFFSIKNLIESSQMVRKSNTIIKDLDHLFSLVKDAETGQRGYLLTEDIAFLDPYTKAKEKISGAVSVLSSEISGTQAQNQNFDLLKTNVEARVEILDRNLNEKKQKNAVTTAQLLAGKKHMDQIRTSIESMQAEEKAILQTRTESLNKLASYTPLLIIFSALLAITITLVFFRKVSQDYNEKNNLTDELKDKNEESENRLAAIGQVAAQISAGDYNILLDRNAKKNLGSIAEPLNKMAQSLQNSFNSLAEKEWLSSAIAQVNDRTIGDKNTAKLATDILASIIEHTNGNVAAIYLQKEDNHLHLKGSFAMEGNGTKKVLKVGQGIVGEAFRSGKKILVEDIADNESTISYATGNTKPKNIIAIPITRYNMPLGVIEVGSTTEFTPLHLEFLQATAGNIGLAFYSAQSRIKMQELLEETQAQSEELQTQHAELENINAELEAQSQKLLASEEELRVQQEELMQSNQELEERTSLLEEKNVLIEERNIDIQQKSIELQQSTRYKSEFLANMSHELRTPLNSILLLSKLMTESDDLDEQYVEYGTVMQSSGQGLLTLIDEILDLSKIESGKMTLEINEVPLEIITSDLRMLFKPMAKEKNLDLIITIEPETLATINTDKLRLEQILKNLLSNAIKFTSEGSIKLQISNDDLKQKVLFTVIDTGIGIAEDKLMMVFEAFQQADGSTQRKYGGTGLGLSISRELARLLGGEINLKSTEGVGSQFTLIVPVDFEDAEIEEPHLELEKVIYPVVEVEKQPERYISKFIPEAIDDDRENIEEGDKIILIIEDDTAFAKILLNFARSRNYKVIATVRGDIGIELAQHYKPLAILLDIQLPIMDGWQVMEALKSNPVTKPIPVHIMSSMKFKQESLLRGAVDFINKPFALEQMQEVFKKLENALVRSPKKVLIVEENEQHAKALSYFLSVNNINTDIVNNVAESIDALHNQEIDCVILDMGMPDKNAYETLETIKQNKGLEHLPIIVFTGKSLSKGEENRIKKYADSIVVKTAYSYQRILDEAGLFLHIVEEKNKKKQDQVRGFENSGELRNILKDKTVLLADDDVRNIFSLTKALELHGMKVLPAMDGKEALKVLNSDSSIDIVLMDMMMPEMDGYESIREIRTLPQFKNLPVLAVTSKAMMGDREKCIAVGASDYISKPVDIDQLVSLLRVWLYDKM